MMPYICKIGPLYIYSYGLTLVGALVIAGFLAERRAKKEGYGPEVIFNFCFSVFIAGIIGSRIFYVVDHLDLYRSNPLEIIMLQHGGMAWFGGLILGSITGLIYLKRKNLPILKTLDLIIPFIALGQSIGRIGCFLNGCCFGKPSALGVYFARLHEILIPTQIYSSIILLAIFVVLRVMQDKHHRPGLIVAAYLFLYSLKRFFIEFLRADNPQVLWGLTLFQLLSAGMFIFSIAMFFILKLKEARKI